jgi:hypothetical protein
MDTRLERGRARQRAIAVRYLLFCLLVLVGFADVRSVSAQAYAEERWVGGHLAQAGMPVSPCREGAATAAMKIAAPSEHRPDLFPAEGDAVADRLPDTVIGFPIDRACGGVADRVVERKPGFGFSSRAPPVSS